MSNYIAVTIGPIYDTIKQVKRTRSIWMASYFFSWFMRRILEDVETINKTLIHLPYREKIHKGVYGAGLYADRLYFVDIEKKSIDAIITKIIESVTDDIIKRRIALKDKKLEVITYLKNYLNLHIVSLSLNEEELEKIKNEKDKEGNSTNSVLKKLNTLLDNMELNQRYVFDIEKHYLLEYFKEKDSILRDDAFPENENQRFKSIGEIATGDLKSKNASQYNKLLITDFKNEDIGLIDLLQKSGTKNAPNPFKDHFRDYHKYYAVLYADGDYIGALLKSVANDDTKLQNFSKHLLDFGLRAEHTISEYGGSAIYLGGEDILAFLPIAYNDKNTLHSLPLLIRNLDKDFAATLGNYAGGQGVKKIPTLSYGIMLAYYKYPMREAMSKAHDLLEGCKKNKTSFKEKNGIAVCFQKHSGQYMQCYIDKSKAASTQLLYSLFDSGMAASTKAEVLSGIIQRLKDPVFFNTFIQALRKGRADAFFANFFNEDIHSASPFIKKFNEICKALAADYNDDTQLKDILFTVMRYYQFLLPPQKQA